MFSSVICRYTGDQDKQHYQGQIDEVLEDQDVEEKRPSPAQQSDGYIETCDVGGAQFL